MHNDRDRLIDNRYRRHHRLRRRTKVLAFTIFLTLVAVASAGLCLFALKG
ncbi:hypothetical protein [Sphingomonas sp. 8AM]|nr:hypothetical protein [Sphingomonas sp. 8AM]